MQAVLCSSEAFDEKFVVPAEEVEFAPRKETFHSSFADDSFVTTLRNQCSRFSTPRCSVTVCRGAPPAKGCAEEVGVSFSCQFADHLSRRLASSDRPPDNGQIRPAMSHFAVVLFRLKLGWDRCRSDPNLCQPGPTGFFLWPESASIGDIECSAAQ